MFSLDDQDDEISKDIEIIVDLNAVILSIDPNDQNNLLVKTIDDKRNVLPWGRYNPKDHRTMEQGLRHWVKEKTKLELDYVEQLYTFGDQGRFSYGDPNRHILTTGYLAFVKNFEDHDDISSWSSIYNHFPWEDFRNGRPSILDEVIMPKLFKWSKSLENDNRIHACFGESGDDWNDEKVLDRFELMYEAGLLYESEADSNVNSFNQDELDESRVDPLFGEPMLYDHRRILATTLGRIRSKIKDRPVIFDLMPESFTLYDLQKTTEAVLGYKLHKQNFRRFVERENLVIKTNDTRIQKSGRPAKLYCYNAELNAKSNVAGLKLSNTNI